MSVFLHCPCSLESFGHHKFFHQRFDVPAVGQEMMRKVIEQLRMRWRRSLCAEIIRRLDESNSEDLLPKAVDRYASR